MRYVRLFMSVSFLGVFTGVTEVIFIGDSTLFSTVVPRFSTPERGRREEGTGCIAMVDRELTGEAGRMAWFFLGVGCNKL